MKAFLEDFYNRKKEVRYYISALRYMESYITKNGRSRLSARQNLTLETFRAGAMLILYNAVEASMREAIIAIYEEVGTTKRVPFQQLREELRKRIIKEFKKNANPDKHHSMSDTAIELILASFDEKRLFSGNVDAREIRDVAKELGFSVKTDEAKTQNGQDLLTIKNERNNLAHGIKAFSEVGRLYLTTDLVRLSRTSLAYLENILLNIESYLDHEEYLNY